MKKIKFILVNDGAALPRFNGLRPVQSSKFSDLKVQSDPRVDDKVQGSLTKVRATQGSMTKIKVHVGVEIFNL